MASEDPNVKFPKSIKRPLSEYGGSDADDVLLQASQEVEEQGDTDYGSDVFDSDADEEVTRILEELDATHVVLESLEENVSGKKCRVVLPNVAGHRSSNNETRSTSYHSAQEKLTSDEFGGTEDLEAAIDIIIPELSTSRLSKEQQNGQSLSLFPSATPQVQPEEAPQEGGKAIKRKKDLRSPMERFRRPPKKPLSVTDIVTPAWCELQYWYALTKFGKVKRTPAMKQGSKVHKVLEEQVHTYVEIDVKTREDIFGLRMWNIIQGLRTLRATGLTRELEVWGVLDGEVINGVIDELSYDCPDPELESTIELSKQANGKPPPGQKTINQFFSSQDESASAWLGNPHEARTIYITDIKTRAAKAIPKGAAARGTQMQLMLYHKLLIDLATNTVPADTIFTRYNLESHKPFTPSFMGAIADLEDNFIHDGTVSEDHATFNTSEAQLSELASYNSLTQLWSLMITEFQRTIPKSSTMSDILHVEYRKRADGAVVGDQCYVYDDVALNRYVAKTMDWWKGRREAKGVDIEEAFKCRVCEFAPDCEWRKQKVEEGMKVLREKKRVGERKWKV